MVNIGIIIFFNIKNFFIKLKKMKMIIPFLIILLVLALSVFTIHNLIKQLIPHSEKYSGYDDDSVIKQNDCRIIYHDIGERNVILRVDDIQAIAWRDIQMAMINDALARDMTLTLGVIPDSLLEDKIICDFLIDKRCDVEIGLHGYQHRYKEFQHLNYSQADEKIKKGLDIVNRIEPNVLTFIPPDNVYSEDTKNAAIKNGIKYFSARKGNNGFDYTQSSYDWYHSRLEDVDIVLDGCRRDFDNNKNCIIMLHPQDYADEDGNFDKIKYEEYIKLLEAELSTSL